MYSFPFEPREVLEKHLPIQTQPFVEQEVQQFFNELDAVNDGIKVVPVVKQAIDWVIDVYNADSFEIASVPEQFERVLQKSKGIHILDYVLGAFYGFADENKKQQLIDYFFPILQRYKMRISSEQLGAVSEHCQVVEGSLDFSEDAEEIERNYENDLVQRDGAPDIHRFLEEHLNHPLQRYIKAFVAQSNYQLSSLVNPWLDALYERCGQPNKTTINNGAWHIREDDNGGVTLIFHAKIISEEHQLLADHSLEYSITSQEDGKIYGKLEQFTLTPHTDEVRRLCVAGSLFSDHLFPLEHSDALFMNNLEDRLVLDDYLQRFFSSQQKSIQEQIDVIDQLQTDAKTSLHAMTVLAVLQGFQKKEGCFGVDINDKPDYLQKLLQYREGVHFLDYVLDAFYKKVFESSDSQQSKKRMNVFAHHFLPMMLERKIVYPHLSYVGQNAQGKRTVVEPLTNAFDELNKKYSDPEQRQTIEALIAANYATDRDRGIGLLEAILQSSSEHALAIFLKALLSQGNKVGNYCVTSGSTGPLMQWFLEADKMVRENNFHLFLDEISDGYRISIRHGCFNLSNKPDPEIYKKSELSFFHSTLTFELIWNEEQEKAELRFMGLGYTPYDDEVVAPVFARHQCFGEVSKQPQMLTANISIQKDPEAYRSYLKHFLFSANQEATNPRWIDYFQSYMHVSLSVRPVFLELIEESDLPSNKKETIFEKIVEQQISEFFAVGAKIEPLEAFCFSLGPSLRIRFYRQLKRYLDETKDSAQGKKINQRKKWLADLEAKQPNGDALPELEKDFEFWESLKGFSAVERDVTENYPSISFHAGETFPLSENAYSWLFDEEGHFRRLPKGRKGTHYVLPVCLDIPYDPDLDLETYEGRIFEVVIWPDRSSFAMQRLGQRVFGEGMLPRVSTGCLKHQGKSISIEARERVPGRLISNVFEHSKEDLNKIAVTSFTRNFLFSLFALISDLHGRNAVLLQKEDDSFDFKMFDARAFKEQEDIKKPEIINLLLLLNLMQDHALDTNELQTFLGKDLVAVLSAWIEDCRLENKRLADLFGDDATRLYEPNKEKYLDSKKPPIDPLAEDKRNSSQLVIAIGGFIESLLFRGIKLQEELQHWTNETPAVLLHHLLPLVYKFYKPCFEEEEILERFEKLLGMVKKGLSPNTYSSASVSMVEVSQLQSKRGQFNSLMKGDLAGIKVQQQQYPSQLAKNEIKFVAQGRDDFFCPESAKRLLDELDTLLRDADHPKLLTIQEELLNAPPNVKNFEKLSTEQRWLCLRRLYKHLDDIKGSITEKQQRAILNVLLKTPFSTLSLRRYADVITDRDINFLIKENAYHLRTLRLDGTPLTSSALRTLGKKTDLPLAHLSLKNMPNLQLAWQDEADPKLCFPNLRTLDVRDSEKVLGLPFQVSTLEAMYLRNNNRHLLNRLVTFIDKQNAEPFVLHLSGDDGFVKNVIKKCLIQPKIIYEIADPKLQSAILYWFTRNQFSCFGCFPFIERLEALMLPENLDFSVCEKLFSGIAASAEKLKRITIQGESCNPKIILSLFRYLPQVQEIEFKSQEGRKVVDVKELCSKIEYVAMTSHYIAIRKTKAVEDGLAELGILQDVHKAAAVSDVLFFEKEMFVDKRLNQVGAGEQFFYAEKDTVFIPAIASDRKACSMVAEQVSLYVQKNSDETWVLDLDKAVQTDPSCLKQYKDLTPLVSLRASIAAIIHVIRFYKSRDSKNAKNDPLLSVLPLLTVPKNEQKDFSELVVRTLSEYTGLSDNDKYDYLCDFSVKQPDTDFSLFPTCFYNRIDALSPNAGDLAVAINSIQIEYEKFKEVAERLWPMLWKTVVKKAVEFLTTDEELSQAAAAILFQLVLQDHPDRVDALTNDEWLCYYLALERFSELDLSDFVLRRIQMFLEQENGLSEDDLSFLQALAGDDTKPLNPILHSILLLYGKRTSEDPKTLEQAVRSIFAIVGEQKWLEKLCDAPCLREEVMSEQEVLIAMGHFKLKGVAVIQSSFYPRDRLRKIQQALFKYGLHEEIQQLTTLILEVLEDELNAYAGGSSFFTSRVFPGPLFLETSVYHWLAGEPGSEWSKEELLQLLIHYEPSDLVNTLYGMNTEKERDAFYSHVFKPEHNDKTLPGYFLTLGDYLLKSDKLHFDYYGRSVLRALLTCDFEETSSTLSYYKGCAAYLLEDYRQAAGLLQKAAKCSELVEKQKKDAKEKLQLTGSKHRLEMMAGSSDKPDVIHLYWKGEGEVPAVSRDDKRSFIIHLETDTDLEQIIGKHLFSDNISFEMDDPKLQGAVLYWLAKRRDTDGKRSFLNRMDFERLPFIQRSQHLVLLDELETEVCCELFEQLKLKQMSLTGITIQKADGLVAAAKAFRFFSKAVVCFDRWKDIRLENLRVLAPVAVTKKHVALQKGEDTKQLLRLFKHSSHGFEKADAFPDYLFFEREKIESLLVGCDLSLLESEILFTVDAEAGRIVIPTIDSYRQAHYMLAEQVASYVSLHPEKRWTLDLDQAVQHDPFCLEEYAAINASLLVSIRAVKKLIRAYEEAKEGYVNEEANPLLSLLPKLTVPEEQKDEFYYWVLGALAEYKSKSDDAKCQYLNDFAAKPAALNFSRLTAFYELIQRQQINQGQATVIANQYQRLHKAVDLLWPRLWVKVVHMASKAAHEKMSDVSKKLYQSVFENHPDRLNQSNFLDWSWYCVVSEAVSDQCIEDRIQLLLKQENEPSEKELTFLRSFKETHPNSEMLQNLDDLILQKRQGKAEGLFCKSLPQIGAVVDGDLGLRSNKQTKKDRRPPDDFFSKTAKASFSK